MANFYQSLEILETATKEEIKSAYRRLARKWHPDANKGEGAEDRFKEINKAYETLKDDYKRSIYDENLKNSRRKSKEESPDDEKWKKEYDLVIKNNFVTRFFVTVFGVFLVSLFLVVAFLLLAKSKDSPMVTGVKSVAEKIDREKVRAGFEKALSTVHEIRTAVIEKKKEIKKALKENADKNIAEIKEDPAESEEEGIKTEGIKRGEKAIIVAN